MGGQFLAGAVFGSLIFLTRWISEQFIAQENRWHTVLTSIVGFIVAMLAGYGVNHLIFVGFLERPRIPLGGPGALSLLMTVLLLFAILQLSGWSLARKSRDYQVVAGLITIILAFAFILGVDYVVFVYLLGFPDIPSGGKVPFVGGFITYLLMFFLFKLLTFIIERSPADATGDLHRSHV